MAMHSRLSARVSLRISVLWRRDVCSRPRQSLAHSGLVQGNVRSFSSAPVPPRGDHEGVGLFEGLKIVFGIWFWFWRPLWTYLVFPPPEEEPITLISIDCLPQDDEVQQAIIEQAVANSKVIPVMGSTVALKDLNEFFSLLIHTPAHFGVDKKFKLRKADALQIRWPSSLNKVRIGHSDVSNLRTAIATCQISEGEVITFYPGDVVNYWPKGMGVMPVVNSFASQVSKEEKESQEGQDKLLRSLRGYMVAVNNHYSILGHPGLVDNPAYLGHLCNDPAKILQITSQEEYDKYIADSEGRANARYASIYDCHIAIVATKSIEEGEEVLVPYGGDYWKANSPEQWPWN